MYESLEQWLAGQGVIPELITVISVSAGIFLVLVSALIVKIIATRFLVPVLEKVIRKSRTNGMILYPGTDFFPKRQRSCRSSRFISLPISSFYNTFHRLNF